LGEHNEAVLGGILGLSADDLAALEADGIIGTIPISTIPIAGRPSGAPSDQKKASP
jgi:hypothetical protein